jgi:hypothetical protein
MPDVGPDLTFDMLELVDLDDGDLGIGHGQLAHDREGLGVEETQG